jgi:hypothetical protein
LQIVAILFLLSAVTDWVDPPTLGAYAASGELLKDSQLLSYDLAIIGKFRTRMLMLWIVAFGSLSL